MLTRSEVEEELRGIFPRRDDVDRRRRARARRQWVVKVTTLVMLALGLVGGLGVAAFRSPRATPAVHQSPAWGIESVRSSVGKGKPGALLFPDGKRRRSTWFDSEHAQRNHSRGAERRATHY